MTKQEAIEILTYDWGHRQAVRCPLCRQIAARLLMRYPKNVSPELLDIAERTRWQYTGKEKHS